MSILGPTTEADRTVWQMQAARVLSDLLTWALRRKLPVLHWQLGNGRLVGQCLQADMNDRQAAFLTWADYLHVGTRSVIGGDGTIRMSAITKHPYKIGRNDYRCTIAVTANIYPSGGE